jgi:hypothetical protein
MKKIAVYTCITGDYESKLDQQNYEGADFYFYTDKELTEQEHWIERSATTLFTDPRRNARYHKLLSHEMFPEYDFTIWLDGSVVLKTPAQTLIDELGDADILTSFHPIRKTVREEAEECKRLHLDIPGKIETHVQKMLDDWFLDDFGLAETKVVVRRNNDEVKKFNKIWFYSLVTGSLRDQLTFPYVVWKTGIKVKYMPPISQQPERFEFIKSGEHISRRTYEALS